MRRSIVFILVVSLVLGMIIYLKQPTSFFQNIFKDASIFEGISETNNMNKLVSIEWKTVDSQVCGLAFRYPPEWFVDVTELESQNECIITVTNQERSENVFFLFKYSSDNHELLQQDKGVNTPFQLEAITGEYFTQQARAGEGKIHNIFFNSKSAYYELKYKDNQDDWRDMDKTLYQVLGSITFR